MKNKNYIETETSLEWLAKNVPKQKESQFIRDAVRKEIDRIEKKRNKDIGYRINEAYKKVPITGGTLKD